MTDRRWGPDIVITGMGLACSLGLDRARAWRELSEANGAIGPLTALEQQPASASNGLGGQAPDLPDEHRPDLPREVRYLRHALAESMRDAGLSESARPYSAQRCGLVFGTTLHGMRAGGRHFRQNDFGPLAEFQGAAVLDLAGRELGLRGDAVTTCAACSSGLTSLALAVTLLKNHELDMVIAGGYDPISEYAYGGFSALRLIAEDYPKPFCRNRDGMKLGEGYGALVLERAEEAAKRRAPQHWPILGFGETADAHHLTQPRPDGDGAARAMETALKRADLTAEDIGLISAHATGTPDNEVGEAAALRHVFAERLSQTPIVALKSHLGHTLGGAGAVELILAITALAQQRVPPTAHVNPDELEYGELRFVTGAPEPAKIDRIMNLSFGFGGANTALIVGREDQAKFSQGSAGSLAVSDHNGWPDARASSTGITSSKSASISKSAPAAVEPAATAFATTATATASATAASAAAASGDARTDVVITGMGVVLPHAIGNEAFAQALAQLDRPRLEHAPLAIDDEQFSAVLKTRRVRRMSNYVKLSLAATRLACAQAGLDVDSASEDQTANPFNERCGAILGTAHGSADYCAQYYEQIIREGIDRANPMLFAEGVPNAGAAHLSLMLGLKGPCQTIIGSRTAGLDALRLSALRVSEGAWDRAVVSTAEEATDRIRGAYKHCGLHAADDTAADPCDFEHGFVMGPGATTLILERREVAQARGARVHGTLSAHASAYHPPAENRVGIDQVARLYERLGRPKHLITSMNSTRLGQIELAGIRKAVSTVSHASTQRQRPAFAGAHEAGQVPTNHAGSNEAGSNAAAVSERTARDSSSHDAPSNRSTTDSSPIVSSLYGHIAETFSVGPLAGITAALLTARLPRLCGNLPDTPATSALHAAGPNDQTHDFAVMSLDPSGPLAAVRIRVP